MPNTNHSVADAACCSHFVQLGASAKWLGLHPGFPSQVSRLSFQAGFPSRVSRLGFHPGFPSWVSMQSMVWSELSGSTRKKYFKWHPNDLLGFMATFLKKNIPVVFLFYTLPQICDPLPPLQYVHYLSAFKIFKITFVDVAL